MNKKMLTLMVLVSMGCDALGNRAARATPTVVTPTTTTTIVIPKWDYMIQNVPDLSFTDVMTELGSTGWELVFARRASNGDTGDRMVMSYECIFKRPRTAGPVQNGLTPVARPQ
jgi:hypothetical protein